MDEFVIAAVVCACVLGGTLLGIALRRVVPPDHLNDQSRQIVIVAIGLIGTLAALVLGLMVASAKGSFDARNEEIKVSAAKVILLDRALRQYGAQARPARDLLRELTQRRIDNTWGARDRATHGVIVASDASSIEQVRAMLFELKPGDDAQRWLMTRALALTAEIEQARWLLVEENRSSIPMPFLVVLVFWLTMIFASLSLFAPPTATVHAVMFVCAISVATAIFMILEMDQPYDGILRISSEPLRSAVREISK